DRCAEGRLRDASGPPVRGGRWRISDRDATRAARMGTPALPRALDTEAHGPGARDAGGDCVQTADHGARNRRDSRSEHIGCAVYAARAALDQDRRAQEHRWPTVPLCNDEGLPDSLRPEGPRRPAEDRGYGRSTRLRPTGRTDGTVSS